MNSGSGGAGSSEASTWRAGGTADPGETSGTGLGKPDDDRATAARGGTVSNDEGREAGVPAREPLNETVYANVTSVSVSGSAGSYTFAVTVESADIDCTQFANWWEILDDAGTLLYRRILSHSHTDENGTTDPDAPGNAFTRDGGPVGVSATTTVLVRAHMSTGGYHGAVMRGSVEAGFAAAPDIGSDFAVQVESAPPQPTGCEF